MGVEGAVLLELLHACVQQDEGVVSAAHQVYASLYIPWQCHMTVDVAQDFSTSVDTPIAADPTLLMTAGRSGVVLQVVTLCVLGICEIC